MGYNQFDNPLNLDIVTSPQILTDDFLMVYAAANPGQWSRIKARELTGSLIVTDVTIPTASVLTL